jgi:hypothetical protein
MSVTYEERKKVFDNIKLLVKPEQEELFRIIRKYKESYTENSNGIFFDLGTLTDEAFTRINEYLNFCLKNRMDHEERIKEMNTLRNETYVEDDVTTEDSDSDSQSDVLDETA